MLESLCLPFVKIEAVNGKYHAIAMWELANVLSSEIAFSQFSLETSEENRSDGRFLYLEKLFRNRIAFAQAIASWPSNVVVELHITSLPHLRWKMKGKLQYNFILRVTDKTHKKALSLAIKYSNMFQGLLNSCFPEVEFSPVRSAARVEDLHQPFSPHRANLILRRRENILIAKALTKNKIGFIFQNETSFLDDPSTTYTFPWTLNPLGHERLANYLLWVPYPVWILIKISSSRNVKKETQNMRKMVEECDGYITGAETDKRAHKLQLSIIQTLLLKRSLELDESALRVQLVVLTLEEPDSVLLNLLGESVSGKPVQGNMERFFWGGFRVQSVAVEKALDPYYVHEKESFSPEEVASVIQIPFPPQNEFPGITVKRFRSAFADLPEEVANGTDKVLLGTNIHRGIRQPVYSRLRDRLRHMFVIGMTGTGKSTLMENLILQDIENGFGLCVIDPHGELIEHIMGKIPSSREEDVILFDPLDKEYAVGFNIVEWKTIEERDLIIDNLYQTLDQIYDLKSTGGPIFEQNFRNMLKLLMGDRKRTDFTPTLLYFQTLYLSRTFRSRLRLTMSDPMVKSFLRELERTGGEASLSNLAPYITSKFARFTNDTTLRRIIGQGYSTIDMENILEERKILLVNLCKGRFGSTVSSLLTSQIITRFRNAAMKRAEIPENERTPFFLYVDEFQNVNSDDFVELLAEARKYGLGLILANQFTSQINKKNNDGQSILDAILGNVGTFVVFRLGIDDARKLQPIFYPHFRDIDLKELPNWQAYVRLSVEGKVIPPFNIETVMNESKYDRNIAERIREMSRKRYARPVKEVDEEIREGLKFINNLQEEE